jgi:hypothetical protein
MFGLFRKKTKEEIEREEIFKALKRSAKEIKKNKGMYLEVCVDFVRFAKDDELFNAAGILWDKHVPHKKLHVAHASLMLLGAIKSGLVKDKEDDFCYNLAKFSYENCNLIMSTEEIQPLLADLDLLQKTKEDLKNTATNLWIDWENTDVATLKRIAQF